MKWIEYNGQELEFEKDYLVTHGLNKVSIAQFKQSCEWKILEIEAFAELPKPYEKPKSLKERLDEAVGRYCYKFSDKEWNLRSIDKYYIIYSYKQNSFGASFASSINHFSKYTFRTIENAQNFIISFTTDELMQIMKGEVK